MGKECVIIFATIILAVITARADKDTFSMTTKDRAQVRGVHIKAQEPCPSEPNQGTEVVLALHTAFSH